MSFRGRLTALELEMVYARSANNSEKLRELEAQHDELSDTAWDEAYIRACELDSPNSRGFEALRWRIYAELLA